MCFFVFCEFKNSLQNVLFYFCQNEKRFKTFIILFAKTKNASKMRVSFLNIKRARKRDAPQGAVPCVFEISSQGREGIDW